MPGKVFIRAAQAVGVLALLAAVAAIAGMIRVPVDQTKALATPAGADFSDVLRYVFVPSRTAATVTVIDRNSDTVVGVVNPGLVPAQVIVSEATGMLAASDGATRRLAIFNLANGRSSGIDLDFTPQRLVGTTDGYMVAVADLSAGIVAFVELMRKREVSRVTGLSAIRDLMFGSDGAFFYVATEGSRGIGVIDVARGKLIAEISMPHLRSGDVTGLTRAPNGRIGYVKARGGGASLVDLSNFRMLHQVDVARGAAKAFPTGYGGYVVMPDNAERTVSVMSSTSLSVAAMFKGPADVAAVYSGWFDTIVLIPGRSDQKLLVYDLDRLSIAAEIALPGRPGLGAVTADGAKFYLALEDAGAVAVVDLKTRRLTGTIPVGPNPGAAIMARSFDICH